MEIILENNFFFFEFEGFILCSIFVYIYIYCNKGIGVKQYHKRNQSIEKNLISSIYSN